MAETIAILNSNEDVLEMLRMALEQHGFNTVTAHVPDIKRGQTDFLTFVKDHEPAAIVYDIAPPYAENWTFLKLMQDTTAMKERSIVLTTANKALLQQIVGSEIDAYELSEKPYTLQSIIDAVKRVLGRDAA